jgi:hypothetical protein
MSEKSTTNAEPDNRKIASCIQRAFRDPKETISVPKESSTYVGRQLVSFLIGFYVFPMMVTSPISYISATPYMGASM